MIHIQNLYKSKLSSHKRMQNDDDDVNVQDYYLPTTRYEGIDHLSIIKKMTYFLHKNIITLTDF